MSLSSMIELSYSPTDDELLVYHQLWRALLNGHEAPSRRAALPIELVRIVSRMALLSVVDRKLSRESEGPTKATSIGHSFVSRIWFSTEPLDNLQFNKVAGVQLITESCDQGWADNPQLGSRTWFDIGVIPPPTEKEHETKVTHLTTIDPEGEKYPGLMTLQGYGEETKDEVDRTIAAVMALDPLWRRSHGCPPRQRDVIRLEGPVFTSEDGLWDGIKADERRVISVRASAIFAAWSNMAYGGQIVIWKYFEPIIPI